MTEFTLESLWPKAYRNLAVVQSLPMAGYPALNRDQRPQDIGSVFWKDWSPNFLNVVNLSDHERFAFCNKVSPHAQFDNMLIQVDEDVRSSVNDITLKQALFAFNRAFDFVEFVSRPDVMQKYDLEGGHLHLVYNTDPNTTDRENGMGYTKRYHFHFNYWKQEQLEISEVIQLQSVSSAFQQRRLVDPVTYLAGRILKVLCEEYALFLCNQIVVEPQDFLSLPPGFCVKLNHGWSTLKEQQFIKDLRQLHILASKLYGDIQEAFLGTRSSAPIWQRHSLLSQEDIAYRISLLKLPDEIKVSLVQLSRTLRNTNSRLLQRCKTQRNTRVRHLAMNGLCYSTGFYSKNRNTAGMPLIFHDEVWMVIQTKLFADIGGAGMIYTGDIGAIELKRNARAFTEAESKARSAFQNEFIEYTTVGTKCSIIRDQDSDV